MRFLRNLQGQRFAIKDDKIILGDILFGFQDMSARQVFLMDATL